MKKTLAALACLAVLGCSRAPETSAQTVAQKIPTDFYVKQIHDLAVDAGAGAKFWSLGRHLREVDVYRDDLRRYSIRFERYGDFLTVMVDRRGAKTSETLNLGSTRGIRLISGHAPDLGGRLGYVVDETPDDPVHHGNWGTLRSCQMVNPSLGYCGMSYGGPPDNGFHYTVSVEMPPARKKFPTLFVSTTGYAQSTSPESWSGGVNTYVYQTTPDVDDPAPRHNYDGVETRGVARDAEDDQIMLDGIGAIIFAPAGRGAAVLDALEREIARGWSPKR